MLGDVGFVPQKPWILSGSLAENVAMGRDGDLAAAVRAAVLERDLADFPDGLETEVPHNIGFPRSRMIY